MTPGAVGAVVHQQHKELGDTGGTVITITENSNPFILTIILQITHDDGWHAEGVA